MGNSQSDQFPKSSWNPELKPVDLAPLENFDLNQYLDDDGFFRGFVIGDPAASDFFKQWGFVVFADVLTREETSATLDEFFNDIPASVGFNRDDPSTWERYFEAQPFSRLGIMGRSCDTTRVSLLNNRQNPRLHAAYAQLFGTEKLWVDHDRIGLLRPTKIRVTEDNASRLSKAAGTTSGVEQAVSMVSMSDAPAPSTPASQAAPEAQSSNDNDSSNADDTRARSEDQRLAEWEKRASSAAADASSASADSQGSESSTASPSIKPLEIGQVISVPEWRTVDRWLHMDSNPLSGRTDIGSFDKYFDESIDGGSHARIRFDSQLWLQGLVALTDARREDGGFQCVPGSHATRIYRTFGDDAYVQRLCKGNSGNIQVPPDHSVRKYIAQIPLRAGSLVTWNTLTLHANFPNDSDRMRAVMYVRMMPALEKRPYQPLLDEDACAASFKIVDKEGKFSATPLGRKLFGWDEWAADDADRRVG